MKITQDNFDEWLAQGLPIKAVLFEQGGCPACRAMYDVLKSIHKEHPHIEFLPLNGPANPKIRQRIQTPGYPTLVLFENGQPKTSLIGLTEAAEVSQWLKDRVPVQTEKLCEFCASVRERLRPYLPARLMKWIESYAVAS
jgi:thioredoxin-like negative regulator of GroEL